MSTERQVGILDIGTSETRAVVANVMEPGSVEVLAHGKCASAGIARGGVVDIEATTRTIAGAVSAVREDIGFFPPYVFAGANGECIRSFTSSGTIAISGRERGITQYDVSKVLKEAGARNVPADHRLLEVVPGRFQVDQMAGIQDPVGMSGNVLAAEVYTVVALQSALTDLERCIKGAGLHVRQFVPAGLSASLAVLSDEEKVAGVAHLDIGGGTSNLVVYYDGDVLHSETIPLGGALITNSIARQLTCSMETAESLKRTYGVAKASMVAEIEKVPVKRIPPRPKRDIPRRVLSTIIEDGMDRILVEVQKTLQHRNLANRLFAGVILTGGTAMLGGVREKVESYLKVETHVGIPSRFEGCERELRNPEFATAAGVLEYSSRHDEHDQIRQSKIGRFLERVGGFLHHF